jgi:undecaprenyl-diphosphatase
MDLSIYHTLNDAGWRHDWFEDVAKFLATKGEVLFIVLLAILWFARGRLEIPGGRRAVVAAGFSALLGLGVNQVISHIWERTRPYVHHHHHLFIPASHDPSFPSDHATASFALATAIWMRNRVAGAIALVLAAAISVSRVVVGTHYPSDVVGGAAIGVLAALVFWLPPVRRRVDRLADAVSELYERLARAVLRQPIRPSAGVRP